MNIVYVIAAILALILVLLIAGFVKHVRESTANARRIEREISEHRERLNRELIERLHREAQSLEAPKPRARAYPIAARSAAPNTTQQNSVPVQSVALETMVPDPVPDFSEPLKYSNFAPAEACNARSFAPDSSPSYSCDSSSSYDSSSSSCDSGSSSCGGGGESS